MTNIASISGTITGTADGDILIGLNNASSGATTIDGGVGNDVIFGDHNTLIADTIQFNSSIANAFDLDPSGQWSTFENPDVGDTAIPYTTVLGTGANERDFFSVTIGAGETITIDADWGNSSAGGNTFDGVVRLLDASGVVVATDDDSPAADGGLGSTLDLNGSNSRDPLLTTTVATAGTYYIEFGRYLTGATTQALVTGDTYTLNVSVTGHAATGAPQGGNDSLLGGSGDDVIYGMAGNDFISGGTDNDRLYGGSGHDTLAGEAGNDLYDGGDGNDLFFAGAGADTMLGGAGNDQLTNFSSLDTSGQVFDGGADVDLFSIIKSGGIGTVDLRDDSVTGIEFLNFSDNGGGPSFVVDEIQLNAAQFADFTTLQASGHAGQT
ncbi:MAG: calcium-binding protein, partial [Sulfitobacter sp.]